MLSLFHSLTQMEITFIILGITIILFIHGKIRTDLISISCLIALIMTGILTPTEALSDFASPIIVMIIALFMVGSAIFRTGLANIIGNQILRFAGTKENSVFIFIFFITCAIGGFLSSIGTIAIMIPIILSVCAKAELNPRRFLMPVAFASSLGLFTVICTTQNLIVQDVITKAGYPPLSFFSFAPIGTICVIIGIFSLFFLSKLLTSKDDPSNKKDTHKHKKLLNELIDEYKLAENTFKIMIPKDSLFIGKTLSDLNISSNYNVTINKIVYRTRTSRFTKEIKEVMATSSSVIKKGNILFCQGIKEDVEFFTKETGLEFFKEKRKGNLFDFRSVGISEIFILPNSSLIGRTVADVKFRDVYNVKVIGVKHEDEYRFKINDIKNTSISFGDSLLVEGSWKDLDSLYYEQNDFVLQGRPLKEASELAYTEKAPIIAVIMFAMILAMAFEVVPAVVAVLLAVLLIIITGCLRSVEEAYNSVSWSTVVLMAGMMPMAKAFDKTGITEMISNALIHHVGNTGPYALLIVIYVCATIIGTFVSNTAAAVLVAPIALKASILMGVSPIPFMYATAVASVMSFTSPFSTAQNALVMSVGRYKFIDYVKVGMPLQILIGITMIFTLPLIYPF